MISATVSVQWDDLTGLNTNKGVRERLHEQFDVWLDLLEEEMERKEGKLDELVRAIFEARHELTGLVAESLVDKLHSKELKQTEMLCPKCEMVLT